MIYMSDIRNRITNLNESSTNNLNINVESVYSNLIKTNPINLEMAKLCIDNYLAMNSQTAFSNILEMFDLVCERNNTSDIKAVGYVIIEAVIPKVRDGVQTNALIKHKLSRFKTKLSTKINNNVSNTSDAVKDSVAAAKKNLGDNVNKAISNVHNGLPHKKEEQEKVAKECYEKMLEKSDINNQCDRVLVNYEKLSKRFNLDKIVRECGFYDLQRAVSEVCNLIDTYTVPYKAKFNIALESSMYALERNAIPYTRNNVLNFTADYFLCKEDAKVTDLRDIIKSNPFFSDEDKTGLEYITELDPKIADTNPEIPNSYNIIMNLDNFTEASAEETVKDLINKFKLLPNKTIEGLKALVRKIYTKTPDQICSETPNFLSWIRMALIDGGAFAIHPVVGVVVLIADQAIAMSFKRDETKKMLESFKSEKNKAEKKLSSVKTDETKKKYEEYIKSLDKSITKINDYYEGLHTSEENSERYDKEHPDNDSDDDFNFDVNFEASILNMMGDICAISEVSEELCKISTKDYLDGLLSDIDDNISKMSLDDIDSITSVFTLINDKIAIDSLSETFHHYKDDIRKPNYITSESSSVQCLKYMTIDCLNDNIAKLEAASPYTNIPSIYSSNPEHSYKVLNRLKAKLEAYNCLYEMMHLYNNKSTILEASFTNSLKMAGEKLKKSIVKLSDADKTASRNIDMTMGNFTKAAERAVTNDNREAIIKGSVLPSASKMLKMALAAGATAVVINPVIAVIGVLGYLGASSKMKAKERQAIIDEIEIELKMVDRYMKIAEDNNDLQAQRQLLTTQRTLERQLQRIKYKMKVDFKQDVPSPTSSNDD